MEIRDKIGWGGGGNGTDLYLYEESMKKTEPMPGASVRRHPRTG